MSHSAVSIAPQFDEARQARDSARLGMWIFLATEVMLFGGLFLAYTRYRLAYPEAFRLASHETDFWLGTINTAVLLTSSLTMVLAVHAAQAGRQRLLPLFLLLTMCLGMAFLGTKGYEYYEDYTKHLVPGVNFTLHSADGLPRRPGLDLESPGPQNDAFMFFVLYFFMTGLHAVHLCIGVVLMGVLLVMSLRGKFGKDRYIAVEISGIYWHLIDVIWIFLYPLLYLAGRHP